MPIHDQSYRRYGGERAPQGRSWTVIAQAGIKNMLGKKKFLALVALAWLPFIVRTVQFYVAANFPQASMITRGLPQSGAVSAGFCSVPSADVSRDAVSRTILLRHSRMNSCAVSSSRASSTSSPSTGNGSPSSATLPRGPPDIPPPTLSFFHYRPIW